ncbi:MAG: ABC transporter ATP-binding protein [Bacteroidota bacterium]|nr:ABC transporter ATP-binding protein [Bacteroidota bacterium]
MSDVVIKVENLGKRYRIGEAEEKYDSYAQKLLAILKYPVTNFNKLRSLSSFSGEESSDVFWALKDISFEVNRGDMLGIIGNNGAGKSTLLKILSRITDPTTGRVTTKGRVSSLLEVGTGFHHDLSGRENVYMNGTILGMSKKEIDNKFDEIVNFSEIEKFIDTPVKRYSSGMKVRLAFSVAAHLEPDILIVDEVLAVGDSAFQTKCIDKMTEVSRGGRTILFVSHQLSTIKSLCTRGILLSSGGLVMDDTIEKVLHKYTFGSRDFSDEIKLGDIERKAYGQNIIFDEMKFEHNPINYGQSIDFNIKLKTINPGHNNDLEFGVVIKDKNFNPVVHVTNRFINKYFSHNSDQDEYRFEVQNNLRPGTYYMNLFLKSNDVIQDWLKDIVKFDIKDGNPYGYKDTSKIQGIVFPQFDIGVYSKKER